MAEHPLGWVEHRLAWSPTGELGQWAARNPGDRQDRRHLVRARRHQRRICQTADRRGQPPRRRRHGRGRRQPKSILNDPLGPLWYRGLVGRDADAEAERARRSRRRRRSTIDQELDAVLAAYGASGSSSATRRAFRASRSPTADGSRASIPAFALLRRAAELARDHRRHDDSARGGEAGVMKPMLACNRSALARSRSRRRPMRASRRSPCSQRPTRSRSRSRRRSRPSTATARDAASPAP